MEVVKKQTGRQELQIVSESGFTQSLEVSKLMKTNPRWLVLQEDGQFEIEKAELSLMYAPANLAKINPASFKEIFQNQTPTLATVKKYHGEAKGIASICACLIAVNDFFGDKSGLDEGQIQTLASLIYSEYFYLTLADLKYCIKQGILGRYEEKIYGKATPDVIMRWINLHINDRQSKAADIAQAKHEASKTQQQKDFERGEFLPVSGVDRDAYVEKLKSLREKMDVKARAKKEEQARSMLDNEKAIKNKIDELNEALRTIALLKESE